MVHNSEPESPLKCSAHVDNGNRVVTRIETGEVSILYNVQLRRDQLSIQGAGTGEWGPNGAPMLRSGVQMGGTEDWATEVLDPNRAPHRVPVPSSGSKQGACTGEWGPNRAPHRAPTLRSRDQMRLHTGHLY